MEVLALLLIPLAISLVVKLVKNHPPSSPDVGTDDEAKTNSVDSLYVPPTFRVVALGAQGSGKTVFLSSLFHTLNFQTPGRSYYLETDPHQRVTLGRIYSTVSDTASPWPRGTRTGETREFVFDCVGVAEPNTRQTVLRISYLDYAGELFEVEQEGGGAALGDLDARITDAHALLCMIDGYRVLQLLNNEREGREYFEHSLPTMLGFMQKASCPIHFMLTKWDLVREFADNSAVDEGVLLDRVIDALMSFDHIKALVYVHSKRQIVRLIPVSAVGSSFADLDGRGKVIKRSDGELRPTNIDVPLCAVLPDLFNQVERSLDQSVRRNVNAEMLRQMRKDAGALAASVLGRPAGWALQSVLQGALGRDVGKEASTLFLEWIVRPSDGRLGPMRSAHESQLAELQRLRGIVVEDFRKTVLRMEVLLPSSVLSKRG